jgi:prepilin peptidase CpaA
MFESISNQYGLLIALNCVLLVSAVTDYKSKKIPNIITVPAVMIGLIYHFLDSGIYGFMFSMTGLLTGFAILIIPYLKNGMGAGDVKLLGVVGAFVGAKHVFYAFLIIAVIGGVHVAFLMLLKRASFPGNFKDTLFSLSKNSPLKSMMSIYKGEYVSQSRPKLCYGLAIAFGTGIYSFLIVTGRNPFVY